MSYLITMTIRCEKFSIFADGIYYLEIMAFDNRDSIDFATTKISTLFRSIFIPTLLGMLFNVAFILTDGIFVGHGIGPRGLASVNLVAPLMMFITGIGMMFGIGSSVVAAIHLSQNNEKAARINITQGFVSSLVIACFFSLVFYLFPDSILTLLGTSDELLPMAREYLFWFVPTRLFIMIAIVSEFSIRLDGSPQYAMYCAIFPAVINIILDYVFIFHCHLGLKGAALATDIGTGIGVVMILWYYVRRAKKLRLYRIKMTMTSMRLFARNVGYMIKVGFSGFIGELALSVMALCGNLAFGKYIGDMGIAAFCIVCYLYPIVYNVFYAVSTSAQPILSYNYGANNTNRVNKTFHYSIRISLIFALLVTLGMWFFAPQVVAVFLNSSAESFHYAASGLPLFALGFVFIGYNVSAIGYFQSVEANAISTLLMSLRGIFLPIVMFIVLPLCFGEKGLWLAMPVAEAITFVVSIVLKLRY